MGRIKKNPIPFYVLNEGINRNEFKPYNVMDYLIREYKEVKKSDRPTTFEEFKEFVKRKSNYMYRARCEYEILLASWPFGSYRLYVELKEFLGTNPDLDKIADGIKLDNIIMRDMKKIDVHEQIMMNLDIVTRILMENVGVTL